MFEGISAGIDVRKNIGKILNLDGPITMERLRRGLPTESIATLRKSLGVTEKQVIESLSVSKQTYAKRKATGVLTVEESDRVLRYATLLELAIQLFESNSMAAQWFNTPTPALGNETPLTHATTEIGGRNVERLIGRIEHGIPT